MATKVLIYELSQIPERLTNLDAYQTVFLVAKYADRPVACIRVPVRRGTIEGGEICERLVNCVETELLKLWTDRLCGGDKYQEPKVAELSATVAICTRDRPSDLKKCLAALMQIPPQGQEILVVDNAPSSDETRDVVRNFPAARYIRENKRGLDNARNCALNNARGEIVAFIDDDAVADSGWLQALVQNFTDPLILCVTGLTLPAELETPAQETFEQLMRFSRGLQPRRFSLDNLSPAAGGTVGAGANMAVRRDVLRKVGGFDPALDAGTLTYSGGDSEMFSRIIAAGYDIVYEPAALNFHRHRRTWEELRETVYGYGVGLFAAWTKNLVVDREADVIRSALEWVFKVQRRKLVRSLLRRPGAYPRDLMWAELLGSFRGPIAYFQSRRKAISNSS